MMECKRQGVHKLFSSNGTKQAYSKFNFPSNMPIRLATTLRKDCFYNPDICACFYGTKKRKLFTYGEYKLAANNLFKTKKTNFFKRAKLASKTLKENCSKEKNIVCSQIWTTSISFFHISFGHYFLWQHVRILLYWTTFVWCIFWYKRTSFIQTIFFLQRFS